ncbi:hypothetical protein B0H14DRAFT_3475167 [Mycena olivaceomarginata]|nr:hypothetical protein B0H14DRAFT_3475167 [Mycena olivaceomarginata]
MPPKQLRSLSICTCSAGIGDTGPSGCAQEFRSLRCPLGRPVHGKRKTIAHELIQPCSTSTLGIDSQRTKVRKVPQRTKGHLSLRQIAPMTAMASPTNMTSTDMIPELDNAAHDPPILVPSTRAQRGHHTMQGCIAEWQQHCALGVHPHPPESKRAATTIRPIPGPQRNRGHVVEPALQMDL